MISATTGKIRRMQQCATPEGVLVILAIDHRHNLREALNPQDPGAVSDEELVAFKCSVVSALAPSASAVLLDPEIGAEPCILDGDLPGDTGLVLSLERTGYGGQPSARLCKLIPSWGPKQAVRAGASGVKLLTYYHPSASTAPQVEAQVRRVAAACTEAEMPFLLEPLSYSPDPARPKLSPEERHDVVIETARRLTAIPGVDVLKAEFPLDITATPDEADWLAACRELSEASCVPWVLLSAGTDFQTYLHQVSVAVRARASGVAVGRAIWQEATTMTREERAEFLATVARQRLERVAALCQAFARPWKPL